MTFIRISDTLWIRAEHITQVIDNPDDGTLTIAYSVDTYSNDRVAVLMDEERAAMLRWLETHDFDVRLEKV